MRVIATLTLDGTKETRIEGDSAFLGGAPGDKLEQKGLGFWLDDWQLDNKGHNRKGRVFIPWTSALFIAEVREGGSLQD